MHLPPLRPPDVTAPYLACNEVINCTHPDIRTCARTLTRNAPSEADQIHALFTFVRDRIVHTCDDGKHELVWKASDVLMTGHGLCFAKAHLFVALCRAVGIPAGLCYQRVRDDEYRYVLHGFSAVYLEQLNRWIRLDSRGGFEENSAHISDGEDIMIYGPDQDSETWIDPSVYATPWPELISLYQQAVSVDDLIQKTGAIRFHAHGAGKGHSDSKIPLTNC